ncbi:MAG: dihydropteroate synthase [Sulfurospirillum sp.]
MRVYKISKNTPLNKLFGEIGVTKEGSKILQRKAGVNLIYIKDIKSPAANILKQDALSIGADLAVPKDCVTCRAEFVDAILIANDTMLKKLSIKERTQPFGLKDLAKSLSDFVLFRQEKTKIMGVLNANNDSFFSQSRFCADDARKKIEAMMEEGADIIDIGGVSSRPGSVGVSENEEFTRVKDIIETVRKYKLYERVEFSLDSYSPLSLKYALDSGFSIVNDITALKNDEVALLASKYDATVVLMHKLGSTQDMQKDPHYDNVVLDVDDFFAQRIKKAKDFGIKDIILDVGIGFGKKLEHNLSLLQNLEHFLHFDCPLLVGASRKSMIDMIYPSQIKERLPGTLAIHLESIKRGASILRVHDVKEHIQAIKVQKAIEEAF